MVGEKDGAMYEMILDKIVPDLLLPMPTDHLKDLWQFADKIKEDMVDVLKIVEVPNGLFEVKVNLVYNSFSVKIVC